MNLGNTGDPFLDGLMTVWLFFAVGLAITGSILWLCLIKPRFFPKQYRYHFEPRPRWRHINAAELERLEAEWQLETERFLKATQSGWAVFKRNKR